MEPVRRTVPVGTKPLPVVLSGAGVITQTQEPPAAQAQEAELRLGIYGGTFDPVHHGHLILARDAMEILKLDRVIFIPAAISPHKLGTQPAPAELRLQMLAQAVENEPGFEIDESELHREGPSYTVDTMEALRARQPAARYFYLIGSDNEAKLTEWHRYEELRQMVEFVVFAREEKGPPEAHPTLSRRVDISATEIRDRIARGASIRYLVPEPVRLLIEQHRLYR